MGYARREYATIAVFMQGRYGKGLAGNDSDRPLHSVNDTGYAVGYRMQLSPSAAWDFSSLPQAKSSVK